MLREPRCQSSGARIRLLLGLVLARASARCVGVTGRAQDAPRPTSGIDVVQVERPARPAERRALITVVVHDADANALDRVVVFQLDATGAVDVDVAALLRDGREQPTVPIAVWVGPSGGGRARRERVARALRADRRAVAPGAGIGPSIPCDFDHPAIRRSTTVRRSCATRNAVGRDVDRLARSTDGGCRRRTRELTLVDGSSRPSATSSSPSTADRAHRDGDVTLDTGDVVGDGTNVGGSRTRTCASTSSTSTQQLAHTLDTPWVAYFLFVAGLALIVFEFFTAASASPGSSARSRSSAGASASRTSPSRRGRSGC